MVMKSSDFDTYIRGGSSMLVNYNEDYTLKSLKPSLISIPEQEWDVSKFGDGEKKSATLYSIFSNYSYPR